MQETDDINITLNDSNKNRAAVRGMVSRRAMLKGSVVSMPVILTLQSGAALARSSNLISATSSASTDRYGRTLCMDKNSVYPVSRSREIYDLGDPPYARVSAINDRDYRLLPRDGAERVSESQMCREGGTYYYKSHWHWRETNVPRGILISATALISVAGAGGIVINDL